MTNPPEHVREVLQDLLYRELAALYDGAILAGAQPERLRTILTDRTRRLRTLD